jgi:hypothetical protein
MRKRIFPLILVVLLGVTMMACNLPFFAAPQQTIDQLGTAVAQTVQAINIQNPQPTQALQPTLAPLPTLTLQSLPTLPLPPTATPIPCNKAAAVSETYPDNTALDANQTFTKTWRLKNIGSCTWNTNYKIVYSSGNAFGALASYKFTTNTAPGGITDFSINMKSPAAAGTYKGVWKLVGDDGMDYGTVWVQIVVGTPAPAFAVTGVSYTINTSNSAGPCPFTFNFTASITTNGPGTVTYHWTRSDSSSGATQSLVFGAAGTQTVSSSWTYGAAATTYDDWEKIYIDNPNHQFFAPLNFHLACP